MKYFIFFLLNVALSVQLLAQSNTVTLYANIELTFPGKPIMQKIDNGFSYSYSTPNFIYFASVLTIPSESNNEAEIFGEEAISNFYRGLFNHCNGVLISDNFSYYCGYKCLNFNFNLFIPGSSMKSGKGRNLHYKNYFISLLYYFENYDANTYQTFISSLKFP